MDFQIECSLRQTFWVSHFRGRDVYGEPIYGPALAYKCRVAGSNRTIFRPNEEAITISYRILTTVEAAVEDQDRVWLPWEDTSANEPHRVVQKTMAFDWKGSQSHLEVMV